ncbi:hypothetical protein [Pleurocapsa sp. FMAR1]|uniref:hypothetical protein n=1 Tax=Pleurocapsa sp. FMAR1 TaxID=3040204 RepID=UPI0029C6D390|nr:hypothetical protein [Pleurocapsa sp. FMAR1]
MEVKSNLENRVIKKVNQLSVEQIQQVEQFIDSLQADNLDDGLVFASSKLAEYSFERVWNNPEDAEYDNL